MKAPSFWQERHWLSRLLQPVGRHYGMIVQKKLAKAPRHRSRLPVICIGNVTMGGSGKTPVVDSLAVLLQREGHVPAILMRGYGGKAKGPVWVDAGMDADICGDEALLHARVAPTMVSRDRARGAQEIELRRDVTHILMDDGLQNPSLYKTTSLVVLDGKNPFGNGRVFPAGPLRETLDRALRRVQALVVLGEDRFNLATEYQFLLPVFRASVQPVNGVDFRGKPVIAFAGIGYPEKFFQSLRDSDAIVVKTYGFPDHHAYTPDDLAPLLAEAARVNLPLVTTRKDWVRLPPALRDTIRVLDITLQWQDEAALRDFLLGRKV